MKKLLAALLLVAFAATSSFGAAVGAATTHTGAYTEAGQQIFPQNAATEEGPAIGKLSTGVYFAWATLVGSYVIKTQHSSGLKAFATASDSTAINWKPATKQANLPAPPATATNSALINEGGWSVM
jgi:hypothetical protein